MLAARQPPGERRPRNPDGTVLALPAVTAIPSNTTMRAGSPGPPPRPASRFQQDRRRRLAGGGDKRRGILLADRDKAPAREIACERERKAEGLFIDGLAGGPAFWRRLYLPASGSRGIQGLAQRGCQGREQRVSDASRLALQPTLPGFPRSPASGSSRGASCSFGLSIVMAPLLPVAVWPRRAASSSTAFRLPLRTGSASKISRSSRVNRPAVLIDAGSRKIFPNAQRRKAAHRHPHFRQAAADPEFALQHALLKAESGEVAKCAATGRGVSLGVAHQVAAERCREDHRERPGDPPRGPALTARPAPFPSGGTACAPSKAWCSCRA